MMQATKDYAEDRPVTVAIGIPSCGRRDILSAVLPLIARQTRQPDEIYVCLTSPEDMDPCCTEGLAVRVIVIISERGSCRQRNRILAAAKSDVILFLDDDFLMAPSYVEEVERLFSENDDIVVATGTLVADGIIGPGISVDGGLELIEADERLPKSTQAFRPIYNAYGCNMAVRTGPVREADLAFDENLPLYGWLEDVDFSRMAADLGRVVQSGNLVGVHLGTKKARTPGIKFGYSQIANPIYLIRKDTMSIRHAGVQILRNLVANLVKVWNPEPWVDRKGRLRGNARAFLDLLTGRLAPRNVERLE
ncbi:glycosyltransferase [Ensifer sp. T173]|uniref:Glycosyltransferase n=2 Tax=Sinorhizobium/Ensifer group TaxID=227292 RepID=A0AAW4FRD1_9HYPH|nr:glycosyltransferase family 2 protein [Ensifer sp. Root142]AHK45390.1 putative glycosyl transferase [Ensifer adhaerens OV14]KQU89177.1 glycosyltransferase [Ensifer sp. Root31]MBD9491044.1 glycosyltransferase [Ensifer sp. ENS11]MBM3093844.1 glycosyltransferase [Ensifer canadensis]MDP9633522.1 GT2 family glycosyltransferase [Ensifer adhaerens]OMQ41902.1 glycosyltransferase [Ensifer sp. 1H6]PSS62755.1 glycosyltransferase [Ensifer sp. NM-2]